MSDESSAEDKTEDPSDRRLDDARREGKTALSKEGVSAATLLAGAALVVLTVPGVIANEVRIVQSLGSSIAMAADPVLGALTTPWYRAIVDAFSAGAPLLLVVVGTMAAGVLSGVAQTGGGFWPNLIEPDPSKLVNVSAVTKALTKDGLVDTGMSMARAAAVGIAACMALFDRLDELVGTLRAPTTTSLLMTADLLQTVAVRGAAVLVVLGIIDVVLTRRRFFDKMKMTKEELKKEAKEDEGDPHIKGARKRRHRELRRGAIRKEVPRADAIVVNPTHIAVAIRYRKDRDRAPRVIAKGKGAKADAIRALAGEHDIPIVKDIPLARLLHSRVKIGREVPAETYRAVAAVLAFVSKVTGRSPGNGPVDEWDEDPLPPPKKQAVKPQPAAAR
ncbi:MAG TPA: EscU/YscU/HrcU family type III secretion system export apparatus switch protein [Myxococcota bacterium]